MSKLKSFIRWKENEGATGMTTDAPLFTIPYGTFLKFLRPGSRLPVAAVKQLLDIGRTVQYLAAQPGKCKQAAVTVLLQAAAAHFQLSASSRSV